MPRILSAFMRSSKQFVSGIIYIVQGVLLLLLDAPFILHIIAGSVGVLTFALTLPKQVMTSIYDHLTDCLGYIVDVIVGEDRDYYHGWNRSKGFGSNILNIAQEAAHTVGTIFLYGIVRGLLYEVPKQSLSMAARNAVYAVSTVFNSTWFNILRRTVPVELVRARDETDLSKKLSALLGFTTHPHYENKKLVGTKDSLAEIENLYRRLASVESAIRNLPEGQIQNDSSEEKTTDPEIALLIARIDTTNRTLEKMYERHNKLDEANKRQLVLFTQQPANEPVAAGTESSTAPPTNKHKKKQPYLSRLCLGGSV